jgi:hypothetical protein
MGGPAPLSLNWRFRHETCFLFRRLGDIHTATAKPLSEVELAAFFLEGIKHAARRKKNRRGVAIPRFENGDFNKHPKKLNFH